MNVGAFQPLEATKTSWHQKKKLVKILAKQSQTLTFSPFA